MDHDVPHFKQPMPNAKTIRNNTAFRTAGMSALVARLFDLARSFYLYFCVQERGLRKWAVRRDSRMPYHLLYVPDSAPLIGSVNGHPVRVEPGQILWVQPFTIIDLAVPPPARNISASAPMNWLPMSA